MASNENFGRHYPGGSGSPVLVERANQFDYSRGSDTLLVTSTNKEYDMDVTSDSLKPKGNV